LDSVIKDKPVPYDTVRIDYPIDLRLAAECVDATAADLQDLNPSLLRLTTPKVPGRVPGKDGAFELHLPAGTADKFQTAVAAIPADKRVWWRYHKVQDGETLASIARTYRTTPKSIAEANDLDVGSNSNNDQPAPETRLIIPIAPGKQTDTSTYAHATTHYKVRKGDTVESVAENFGVSVKMLRGWNHIKGSSLAGRRVLYLHLPVTRSAGQRETQVATKHSIRSKHAVGTQTASANPVGHPPVKHHKVKRGETLSSIATSYNTTVTALKQDNRNIAALRPGMILVVRSTN
jgi:peptidoglycan lytic transglycosylase D